jgi:hypothetical protein
MSSSLPDTSSRMLRVDRSMEVQRHENPLSSGTNFTDAPLADVDVDWLFSAALSRCGLSHAEACKVMNDLDPSQWAKQLKSRDNAQVSFQRLQRLPRLFWLELFALLSERLGIVIAHPDLADRLTNQLLLSVQCSAQLAQQERALRAGGRR